jgi:hypothetical protein
MAKHAVVRTTPDVDSSFWRSISLEQLASDQNVPPIEEIGELDAFWSSGDVFDDALDEVLEHRRARRRGARTAGSE